MQNLFALKRATISYERKIHSKSICKGLTKMKAINIILTQRGVPERRMPFGVERNATQRNATQRNARGPCAACRVGWNATQCWHPRRNASCRGDRPRSPVGLHYSTGYDKRFNFPALRAPLQIEGECGGLGGLPCVLFPVAACKHAVALLYPFLFTIHQGGFPYARGEPPF